MIVKNNYNECLTNLACSIQKYFGICPKHNTLECIDRILDNKKPKNVVVILFDGMGSRILNRHLDKNSFFVKHQLKEITSVFPATTTAATASIRSGLNPIEHGWLGWHTYISPIDQTITLFLNTPKGSNQISEEFLEVKNYLSFKTITEEINEKGSYQALELFPFGDNKYFGIDEMCNIINKECHGDNKKYIYAYDDEPDHSMHDYGPDSEKVINLIKERNLKIEKLCSQLEDTIVIVVADHGHIKCEHVFLNNYPEVLKMLQRTTSIEQRAVSFKIKDEYIDQFEEVFNKLFGDDFKLYSKKDILDSKLFGDGNPNILVENAIGDYMAIAYNSNKCLLMDGDAPLCSQHAGYSDDEVFIPLIVIDRTKKYEE